MLNYHSVFSASYEPSMLDIRIENPLRQTIAPAKLRGAFSTTSHVMPSLRDTHNTCDLAQEGCGSVSIIHGLGSSPKSFGSRGSEVTFSKKCLILSSELCIALQLYKPVKSFLMIIGKKSKRYLDANGIVTFLGTSDKENV
jgi:hypothetical protein